MPFLRWDRRLALCAPARGLAGRQTRLDRKLSMPAVLGGRQAERNPQAMPKMREQINKALVGSECRMVDMQ